MQKYYKALNAYRVIKQEYIKMREIIKGYEHLTGIKCSISYGSDISFDLLIDYIEELKLIEEQYRRLRKKYIDEVVK